MVDETIIDWRKRQGIQSHTREVARVETVEKLPQEVVDQVAWLVKTVNAILDRLYGLEQRPASTGPDFEQRITKLEQQPVALTPVMPDDLGQRLADLEEFIANQPVAANDSVAVPRGFGDLVTAVEALRSRVDEHDDGFGGLLERINEIHASDAVTVHEGSAGSVSITEQSGTDVAAEVADLTSTVMSAFAMATSEAERARIRINDLDTENVKLRGDLKNVNDRLDALLSSMNEEAKRA